jgi:hypothetical protein
MEIPGCNWASFGELLLYIFFCDALYLIYYLCLLK